MTAKKKTPPPRENRSFITIVVVLLVAGTAVIGYVLNRRGPTSVIVDTNAPLPPAQGYVIGSDSAPVEIVEFGDFECPGCGWWATVTELDVRTRLVATGLARFRFMDFPLPMHPNAMIAHNAAACANAQGKFWEYHDRLFAEQPNWSSAVTTNPGRLLKNFARSLGLETDAFNTCLDNRQFEPQIRANYEEGVRRGVGGTPTFFIGRRMSSTLLTYDQLKALVDSATAEAKADTAQ